MSTNTELIGCVQHDCAKCKAQADAIEALEAQLKNASVAAIAEAAEVDRMKAEAERLTTLAHGQHIELYNARLQLAAAQGQSLPILQVSAFAEGFLDEVEEPPEPNCRCHISPPCNDCVDHSSLRELFSDARRLVKTISELKAAPSRSNRACLKAGSWCQ